MEFDFPFDVASAELETKVPEEFRGLYTEDKEAGKYKLNPHLAQKFDNSKLTSALTKERKTAGEYKAQIEAWQKLGKTPDEVQELLQSKAKTDNVDLEKIKQQMTADRQKSEDALKSDVNRYKTALEKQLVDAVAIGEIASAKGVPELLLPIIQRQTKVVEEEGGKFSVQVVDAAGDPRVNGKGEFLGIKDLVNELKQSATYGRAFEGTGQSGSGTQPNNGAGGNKVDFSKMSAQERLKHGHSQRKQ